MAKRKVVSDREKIGKLQAGFRADLLRRIKNIAPKAVVELRMGGSSLEDHFSDWHDSFRDNGNFTDAFGKSGGPGSELMARVTRPAMEKRRAGGD